MKASKERPTKVVVDLEAISFNLKQIAHHIPSDVEKWAVVKADAYGHGAVRVSQHIKEQVEGFCVSNLDEALELREAGINKKILILGVIDPRTLPLAIEHQLICTVASLEWIEQMLSLQKDWTGLWVHLKIDSGMGRIGFREVETVQRAIYLLQEAGVHIDGLFTHFATADEANDEKFVAQLARFEQYLHLLPEDLAPCIHASNSATTLWHSDTIMDAVRLGDVLYGLNPSGSTLSLPYELRPALSLETELIHVKVLEKGADVGYGATYTSPSDEYIGTIPIGYADGWTRDMQGFAVLVNGERCPIVGRVSMDQITIRLPLAYPIGTRVTLLGKNGTEEITATDVAHQRKTINYEVVCLISDRVPRYYIP